MKLQNIMIADCLQFATNIKGRCEGKEFDELVASVKEKGILVPVLARKKIEQGENEGYYEIIAGNRRFAAAKKIGLENIPAQIVEMNDIEAREAQIIENLQRQDIHPLDEGVAYRNLIEKSSPRYEIKAVALKVGKSESYIKQRLFLTNLEPKPAEAYRAGKINDGHAVLVAKLSAGDQIRTLKQIDESTTIKEIEMWIGDNIYSSLDNQPWLGNPEYIKAVGPCQECQPNRLSLFGPTKEGACTDKKCWERKMKKYIDYRAKNEELRKITDEYYSSDKKILTRNDYAQAKKGSCESGIGAIIVDGSNIGKVGMICINKLCKVHASGARTNYNQTPEETAKQKAEAKKEREAMKKKQEINSAKFKEAMEKLKWPMPEKQLDALLDFAIYRCGGSYQQPAVKLLGIEIVRKEETRGWETKKKVMVIDYEASLRKFAEEKGNIGKLQAIFALLIPHPNNYGDQDFNKAIKKL